MDTVRIGRFDANLRFAPTLDLNDGSVYAFVRDTLNFRSPEPSQVVAESGRRWGGGRVVGESHPNGTLEAEWYVQGANKDDSLAKAEQLVAALTEATPGWYVEDRPDGAARSVYYELRGPGRPEFVRSWARWISTSALDLRMVAPTAPLAVGDYFDIYDPYDVDTLADYTGTKTNLSVANGVLVAGTTSSRTLVHTAKGYGYRDGWITQRINVGGTVATWSHRVGLQASADGLNYLYAEISASGGTTTLAVGRVVAGASTNFASTSASAPAANTPYWLRLRREGGMLIAEGFTSRPTPNSVAAITVTYPLTAAEQVTYDTSGYAVIRLAAGDATSFTYDDLAVEPYSKTVKMPERLRLRDVPGSAPAEATVAVTGPGSTEWAWGLVAWSDTPAAWNQVWNPDFVDDTHGWSVAVQDGFSAATSITRVADAKSLSGWAGEVVTPATSNTGGSFRIYRKFRRGQVYTLTLDLWAPSSTTLADIVIGVSGDSAQTADAALTANRTTLTVTWIPSLDRDYAVVGARIRAATASTFRISNVRVYEGTTAPATPARRRSRAGVPPIGVLEAEASDLQRATGFALTALANKSGGQIMRTTFTGAGSASLDWYLDPGLLAPDDFTQGDLRVEVWAWVQLQLGLTAPRATLTAWPVLDGAAWPRSTLEGARYLTMPSNGSPWRLTRFGALTFDADPTRPSVWRLNLTVDVTGVTSNAVFSVDHLLLVPARRRAASPSGFANDSSYPVFMNSLSPAEDITRLMHADGTSYVRRESDGQSWRVPALGGAYTELGPGDTSLIAAVQSVVPDDPTVDLADAADPSATAGAVHVSVRPRYFNGRGA